MDIPVWVAVLIGIVSTARMTRLITHDDFPPVEAVRNWWVRHTNDSWGSLILCPFCLAPYLTAVQITWFLLLWDEGWLFTWFWLLPHAWWAVSYVVAIIVSYDQPE